MSMMAFYPQIKSVHIATVMLSGSLFLLRGLLVQSGRSRFAMAAPVRYLGYGIDTALLTAALMLLTILPGAMFANGWLATKLVLLAAYVVLGSFALKRARSPRSRGLFLAAAALTYGFMLTIARSHHPLGALAWWFG